MMNRIAITVLSLASTLMPLAAHADPRGMVDNGSHAFVEPGYAPPVVQPVYVRQVGYQQPVVGQRMHDRDGRGDRDDRRDDRRDGRGDHDDRRDGRFERGWHNGHGAQYGQSPRGRWQGQFGGR